MAYPFIVGSADILIETPNDLPLKASGVDLTFATRLAANFEKRMSNPKLH
jgi:hypothetical protein